MRAFFPVPRAKLFGVLTKTRCFNFCLSYTFVSTPISRFLSSVTIHSHMETFVLCFLERNQFLHVF